MQTAQSPNGAGQIIAGQQQVLASLLRARQPQKLPRPLLRVQLGHNDDGCPFIRRGSFTDPGIVPLESQSFARSAKTIFFGLTYSEGHQ